MSSPGAKKRPVQALVNRPGKHSRTGSTISDSAASRLHQLQQISSAANSPLAEYDTASVGTPRSISGRAKSSIGGDVPEAEGEFEDSDVDEGDFGVETWTNRQETSQEKMRMRMLLDSFDESQMARYEIYRRVALNKANVKKLASGVLAQTLPQNISVVIAGSGKVFVGEIVERAREVQASRGHTGPLQPEHLREAYTRYQNDGTHFPRKVKTSIAFR